MSLMFEIIQLVFSISNNLWSCFCSRSKTSLVDSGLMELDSGIYVGKWGNGGEVCGEGSLWS